MARRKRKEPTWDDIGKLIGERIERAESAKKDEKKSWAKCWTYRKECGGGFGRFLFIIGVLYALSLMGFLGGVPLWTLALIVIGFTVMRL